MNYYNFVNTILDTAKSHKLVYEVGEGDIYEHLNSGDHKYPCVFLTVQNVDSNGDQMTVTGSLFYVDALLSDTSNKLQIQSTGMTTLQQIFMRLIDNYPDFDLRTGRYTPFDEKFSDLCAGVFSNFTVSFMDDICIVNDDIFEGDEPITPEPEGKYLTITVDSNAGETIIHPNITGNLPNLNLQYRINNNGDWSDFIVGTTEDIHLVDGDWVQWKGVNPNGLSTGWNNYLNFSISGNHVALSGNVMSLIDGVGDTLVIPNDYCFCYLFYNSSSIKTVSSNFLPANELKKYCYKGMFIGCSKIVNSPELPATVITDSCYYQMFNGCTSLVQAPELPAKTLAYSCYTYMFSNCTSLVNAPSLPATTLAPYCYNSMFYGCTALTTAPELPATTLAGSCYQTMFCGCTALKNTPELPAKTLADSCYYKMFQGCTSLKNSPELPAKTLAYSCYTYMFSNCTSLVNAPSLPATTLAPYCYNSMFYGCTSLVTAPELPATTLYEWCYSYMFKGCTKLVKAHELHATTLAKGCYYSMFYGCTSLNYVKCTATDITATDAITDWLSGVANTGTFVKKYGVEFLTNSPSGIPQGWTVEEIDAPIPPEPKPEPEGKYMTITVDDEVEGETIIHPNITGNLPNLNLQYRINSNGDWSDFIVGTTEDIHLVAGDFVQFKGNNTDGLSAFLNYLNFSISGNPVHLSGNVMSLIDCIGDILVIPNDYCFYHLFENSNVKTVSTDFLPAITLSFKCYVSMFQGCTSLVKAPELPATTLASTCYEFMFSDCTSLENAPELPATMLAKYCYYGMFDGCTSLVNAPSLPATTLVPYCYSSMFWGCTSLTTAPELPATTLAEWCYSDMFEKCTSLVYTHELPATTLAKGCYESMFWGCTSLTTAPELPATTLADSCYQTMFYGCTALKNTPELPAKTLADSCYYKMFQGCTSLTTAPVLPATTLVPYCYSSMFRGCTSLTTAPVLPATTISSGCYSVMFDGCTSLTTAPELPATTLSVNCYKNMFNGCTSLNYVKCTATDITATDAITDWLYGVSPTGTFIKKYGVEYLTNSPSGIPEGWTVEEIDAPIPPEPEGKYMTITVDDPSGETIIAPTVNCSLPNLNGSLPNLNLQYRINNGEWTDFICGTTADIHVVAGDVVQFKGNNPNGISSAHDYLNFVVSGNPVALSGNVMSLIDGVGYALEIPNSYCFYCLFINSKIKTVSSDFLPSTTLSDNCYNSMFYGCTLLTAAPELPATTLAEGCYGSMFRECKSLTTAPVLPATKLADGCYGDMFRMCTSLVNAPELPATTLKRGCYSWMFGYCSNLVKAPELPATTLAEGCYGNMFWQCTEIKTAPELPATKLADNCYSNMFRYCMKLNYVKSLATNITAYNALQKWLYGVSNTGTFVKPSGVSYETGDSGIPSGWRISNI